MSSGSKACILAFASFILGILSWVFAIWTNAAQERTYLMLTGVCIMLALVVGIRAWLLLRRDGAAGAPVGIILAVLALIPVGVGSAEAIRWTTVRMSGIYNLKAIGQAFQAYQKDHGCLPPAAIHDKQGRPLLSWRVLLLPYLEARELYERFHLDEPWDSPHNRPLLEHMPGVYRPLPGNPAGAPSTTYYQVFAGKRSVFDGKRRTLEEIEAADGCASTLLVVEAAEPVPWTKPEDLPFAEEEPLPPRGDFYRKECFVNPRGRFLALFANGSVRCFFHDTPEPLLRPLVTWNGGEDIQKNDYESWCPGLRGEATWKQTRP